MNEYYNISKEYFRQLEGWHLYKQSGKYWLSAWISLSLLFTILIIPVASKIQQGQSFFFWLLMLIIVEILVLIVNGKIQSNKELFIVQAFKNNFNQEIKTEAECRGALINKLLDKTPEKFLATAKEINELLALNRTFQRVDTIDTLSVLKKFYDPDSKARLYAGILAMITVCTALTVRSLADDFSFFESITDPSWQRFMATVLFLCSAVFFMMVGSQVLLKIIWHAATAWATKFLPIKESNVTLHYFARDLIKLYRPSSNESSASKGPPINPSNTEEYIEAISTQGQSKPLQDKSIELTAV